MVVNNSSKIKIGTQIFDIKIIDDLHDSGRELDGWLQPWKSEISLDSRLNTYSSRLTLWHEIVHQIIAIAGIKEDIPEPAIDALAYGVIQILEDNKWIAENPKQGGGENA